MTWISEGSLSCQGQHQIIKNSQMLSLWYLWGVRRSWRNWFPWFAVLPNTPLKREDCAFLHGEEPPTCIQNGSHTSAKGLHFLRKICHYFPHYVGIMLGVFRIFLSFIKCPLLISDQETYMILIWIGYNFFFLLLVNGDDDEILRINSFSWVDFWTSATSHNVVPFSDGYYVKDLIYFDLVFFFLWNHYFDLIWMCFLYIILVEKNGTIYMNVYIHYILLHFDFYLMFHYY